MCVGCAADLNTGKGTAIYDTVPLRGRGLSMQYKQAQPVASPLIRRHRWCFKEPQTPRPTLTDRAFPKPPTSASSSGKDRTANVQTRSLGARNGGLIGTIYIANTKATMQAYPTRGSRLPYHGTSCSATVSLGDIVVGQLSREGNTAITRISCRMVI